MEYFLCIGSAEDARASLPARKFGLDLLEYPGLNGSLRLETPSLGKFSLKNENCQFQLKFDT